MAALVLPASTGCEPESTGGSLLPELTIERVGPVPLVGGTRLAIEGTGFVIEDVAALIVVFQGQISGEVIQFAVAPERVDESTLLVPIVGDIEQQLIRDNGVFTGRITVIREPTIAAEDSSVFIDVQLPVQRVLQPRLDEFTPNALFIGETVTLWGDNFLHPSEGATLVQLSGTMTTTSPQRTIAIEGLQIPTEPVSADRRNEATFVLTPDVLGIIPGTFEGQLSLINTTFAGVATESAPLVVPGLPLQEPLVASMTPGAASRGQWITIEGKGFTAPDGLLKVATVLVLEGRFSPVAGPSVSLEGPNAITLVPDFQMSNDLVRTVLRVDVDTDGNLTGLGLIPGTFSGTLSPLVLFGTDVARGQGLPISFQVLPQRQVVYLKLLPAFDDALAEFGLLLEKERVKERILEVVKRDYEGISIDFAFEPPADFAEYSVVEIAGRDPNGKGLFGLDNTEGKDVGNVRFDDIIGGYNAQTNADGYAAYGGVFPGEFFKFSQAIGDPILANPRFDEIFGAVSPLLGGEPATANESLKSSSRGALVAEAVRVYGNIVGNTISHEIGHSLGLAAVDGNFHNIGDSPNAIMDSGFDRPFAERAEIDGQGPARFTEASRRYLERILPVLN